MLDPVRTAGARRRVALQLATVLALMLASVWWLDVPSSAAVWETRKASNNGSFLNQGETEVVADDAGHVVIAWMDGSPAAASSFTIRRVTSSDGGVTFGPDQKINSGLRLADPSLGQDPNNGKVFLGVLRKDSTGQDWSDVAVGLYRSTDFGNNWTGPAIVNDDGVFNDRDWITTDSSSRVHIVYSPRIQLPDLNWDRTVWYTRSEDGGVSFIPRTAVNPAGNRPPGTNGGPARGIGFTTDGRIIVGIQAVPYENADRQGAGTYNSHGYVYSSSNLGGSWSAATPFTTDTTKIADADVTLNGVSYFKPHPRIKTFGNSVSAVWIGDAGTNQAVYSAVMPAGQSTFNAPVAITTVPHKEVTLPIQAIDPLGVIHVFWLGKAGTKWTLFYSKSSDTGATFSTPEQVSNKTFGMNSNDWAGDFMGAWANAHDLFVAWPIVAGANKGIWLSIQRNVA